MKKLKRMWKSFHKNIIVKGKFRSYWMSLVDKEYRRQISRLFELTKNSTGTVMKEVSVWDIEPGHNIVYYEYMLWLYYNDKIEIDPIKVVSDGKGKFVVVDGNHRFPAAKKRAINSGKRHILCEVIV